MGGIKRLPPFAKRAMKSPDRHVIGFFVYTGENAWEAARDGHGSALVMPDGESPASFRWPVSGFIVTIMRTSPIDAEIQFSLARELLKAGATDVFAVLSGPLAHFTAEPRDA